MTRVVLGSASPGRRKVLQQAGIDPLVVVSGVDEDAIVANLAPDTSPAEITLTLASAKTEAVAYQLAPSLAADCVVIGCDSMLFLDGRLRGKPDSSGAAVREWQEMAGRTGQLFTGHCLIRLRDNAITHRCADFAVTAVRFGRPSESDLNAYIRTGEPLNVAGSFTLDGYGGWFVDGVDGDPSSVIGIGLPTVRRLLDQAGLSLADLWQANHVSN
jgi:septum formation protein